MTPSLRNLLDFRVIIVTGKGGTGKTTVATTLAEAARRSGQRVLLAETGETESAAPFFEGEDASPVGHAGREVRPGLHVLAIDPFAALSEYLVLQVKLGTLVDRVVGTETFQQLLEAVPGWRELIILGKIWHLEQQKDERDEPRYDLIIVDAPATGHGLTFLDVPRVAQQAIRAGPLTRHAGWVEDLIHDRERTLLLPVTLPEELPVTETHELVERARKQIDIAVDRIVVNCLPRPLGPNLRRSIDTLPDSLELEALPSVEKIRSFLAYSEHREVLAYSERSRVSRLCDLPVVDLPIDAIDDAPDAYPSPALLEAILATPVWPDRDPEPA